MLGRHIKLLKPLFVTLIVISGGQVGHAQETKEKLMQLLRAEIAAVRAIRESLEGAVVAFDRVTGCPNGWSEFSAGAGRFIIGVDGSKYRLPYVAGKPDYQTGGSETYALSGKEMPGHRHSIQGLGSIDGKGTNIEGVNLLPGKPANGSRNVGVVTTIGEGFTTNTGGVQNGLAEPHNNMPPYIALYLCKIITCEAGQKFDQSKNACVAKEG